MKYDCIVVGGGIVGMTTARELARRNLNVAIFDKAELGKESSWAAGGILSSMRPWIEHPVSAELSESGKNYYPEFVKELLSETGINPEYVRSGLLMIEKEAIEKTLLWAESNQITITQKYDDLPFKLEDKEPRLFLPDIAQVRPPKLLTALRKSLDLLEVTCFEHTEVKSIKIIDNDFQSVSFEGGSLTANAVVIAAGAWSTSLIQGISEKINVYPVLGEMLCINFGKPVLKPIILDGGNYLIPRLDGQVLIGSTMEKKEFKKETTSKAKENLIKWAGKIWPELIKQPIIGHWAGLRPATDSQYPYVGLLKDSKNIYLNMGHFRKGILQAPICAKIMADLFCGNLQKNKYLI